MKRLRLSDEPVAWKALATNVMALVIGVGLLGPTVGALMLAVVESAAVIFVRASVTPNARVQATIDDAAAVHDAEVGAYLRHVEAQPKPLHRRRTGGGR